MRPVRGFQYAEDKAATELMLAAFAADNPDTSVTVLRGCPVMGPRSENFIIEALRKPMLVKVAGADPPMQLLHEDDLQEALELCLLEPVPGLYNVTGEGTVAFSEPSFRAASSTNSSSTSPRPCSEAGRTRSPTSPRRPTWHRAPRSGSSKRTRSEAMSGCARPSGNRGRSETSGPVDPKDSL